MIVGQLYSSISRTKVVELEPITYRRNKSTLVFSYAYIYTIIVFASYDWSLSGKIPIKSFLGYG